MATSAGLAHVAAVSFLAARAAPALSFWISLAGGSALARESEQRGWRAGYGASIAAMLQTVAIIGPLRFNAPLTQAMSAPLLGSMHARGRGKVALFLACWTIRIVHYAAISAFAFFVLIGREAFEGSYDRLFGWLPFLPDGLAGAITLAAISNFVFASFFSVVQVIVYRHALEGWPPPVPHPPPPPAEDIAEESRHHAMDPRGALLAAAIATALLLATTDWTMLGAVALWLGLATVAARPLNREVLRIGALLAVGLALGTLLAGFIGGIDIDEALRRSLRAALLVGAATWLRLAAGSAGLREAFRRGLERVGFLPATREAAAILSALDSGALLEGSARALAERLKGVPAEAVPVADAVLAWVASEAGAAAHHEPERAPVLRWRVRDLALAASAALPAGVLFAFGGG